MNLKILEKLPLFCYYSVIMSYLVIKRYDFLCVISSASVCLDLPYVMHTYDLLFILILSCLMTITSERMNLR